MKATIKFTTTLAVAALIASVTQPAQGSDVEKYIKTLKGNIKSEVKSQYKSLKSSRPATTSNYRPRPGGVVVTPGQAPSGGRPSVRPGHSGGSTRSMKFSTASAVPGSLRSAASQNKVSLHSGGGGSQVISYHVDSSSKVSTDDVLFRKGSTEFADNYSYGIVRDLAYAMTSPELRGFQFVIEGHASTDGSYSSNQRLSQRRAERIVSEMIGLGVDPWQLVAVGYGESEARYPEHAPEHLRSQDRKVVVYRLTN